MLKKLIIPVLLASAAAAHASSTYTMQFVGSGIEFMSGDTMTGVPFDCPQGSVTLSAGVCNVSWNGALTVVMDSHADGTYTLGDGVESIALNAYSYSFDSRNPDDFLQVSEVDMGGGIPVAYGVHIDYGPAEFNLSGSSASYVNTSIGRSGSIYLNGYVVAIPEPASIGMMLAGLGLLRAGQRRRRS